MGMQMFIASVAGELTDDVSRDVQRVVRQHGGLILMVTRAGPVVALSEEGAAAVLRHPSVEFLGPVTLNPKGVAFERLAQIFAENLSRQIDFEATDQLTS